MAQLASTTVFGELSVTAQSILSGGIKVDGFSILCNPLGTNYNQNIRLPEAQDGFCCIHMGGPHATDGTGANQWSIIKNNSAGSHRFDIRHATTSALSILTGGNVGIGTTAPAYKLDVSGDVRATGRVTTRISSGEASIVDGSSNSALRIETTSQNIGPRVGISWSAGKDHSYTLAAIEPYVNGGWPTDLRFLLSSNGSNIVEQMRLYANGNLSVSGTITATRVYNAVYNDYAEYFLKNEEIEAGDIVQKNPDGDGYIKAQIAHSKLVVGVMSTNYAQCIGGDKNVPVEEQEEKYAPVGLAGRLPVKVVGKVELGDLIVSSEIPGVGMASKEYIPGTVVGKALESYDSDEVGKIEMLIMNI